MMKFFVSSLAWCTGSMHAFFQKAEELSRLVVGAASAHYSWWFVGGRGIAVDEGGSPS
jgi:hypothetical protein